MTGPSRSFSIDELEITMSWLKKLFGKQHDTDQLPPTDSPPELAAKLLEAEKMADQLEDYLLSDKLFWQISVDTPLGTPQPKMTLGSLYERIQYLDQHADELGPNDNARLQKIKQAWEQARQQYPQQWQDKLRREFKSYMHNWRYFLEQRTQNSERWAQEYKFEVRNRERARLVLQLLGPEASADLLKEYETIETALDVPPENV
jgi:phytoene dehydrogenase-like protein